MVWLGQYEALYVWDEKTIMALIENEKATVIVGNWLKVSEKLIKWQAL